MENGQFAQVTDSNVFTHCLLGESMSPGAKALSYRWLPALQTVFFTTPYALAASAFIVTLTAGPLYIVDPQCPRTLTLIVRLVFELCALGLGDEGTDCSMHEKLLLRKLASHALLT